MALKFVWSVAELPEENENLLVEDVVRFGKRTPVDELVERPTVLSPFRTVLHQTKAPVHFHAAVQAPLSELILSKFGVS